MRTISEPACASSLTWMAVPIASTVSVLVIDCTRTGASPPTVTTRGPQTTLACRERRGCGEAGAMGCCREEVTRRSKSGAASRGPDHEARHAARLGQRREVEGLAVHPRVDAGGAPEHHGQRQRAREVHRL